MDLKKYNMIFTSIDAQFNFIQTLLKQFLISQFFVCKNWIEVDVKKIFAIGSLRT
jgi:hypothetical protein